MRAEDVKLERRVRLLRAHAGAPFPAGTIGRTVRMGPGPWIEVDVRKGKPARHYRTAWPIEDVEPVRQPRQRPS